MGRCLILWIPAFAGMTVSGSQIINESSVIPAQAGIQFHMIG